jgi:flagellar basal-body rod protein FlgB
MDLFDNTQLGLAAAIRGSAARQQAIAQNIANVNTPGYRRLTVGFEHQLAAVSGANGGPLGAGVARPTFQYAEAGSADERVALDMELAHLAETSLRHQTLLKALHKHFALIGLAINDGRR